MSPPAWLCRSVGLGPVPPGRSWEVGWSLLPRCPHRRWVSPRCSPAAASHPRRGAGNSPRLDTPSPTPQRCLSPPGPLCSSGSASGGCRPPGHGLARGGSRFTRTPGCEPQRPLRTGRTLSACRGGRPPVGPAPPPPSVSPSRSHACVVVTGRGRRACRCRPAPPTCSPDPPPSALCPACFRRTFVLLLLFSVTSSIWLRAASFPRLSRVTAGFLTSFSVQAADVPRARQGEAGTFSPCTAAPCEADAPRAVRAGHAVGQAAALKAPGVSLVSPFLSLWALKFLLVWFYPGVYSCFLVLFPFKVASFSVGVAFAPVLEDVAEVVTLGVNSVP